MKKYLGLILSAVILLSSIAVNAETNTPKTTEEAVMSVELIENNALEEDMGTVALVSSSSCFYPSNVSNFNY